MRKDSKAIRNADAVTGHPTAQGGTRMLLIPTCPADPMRLAEEAIEDLKREHPPRPVKTSKRKRKATR